MAENKGVSKLMIIIIILLVLLIAAGVFLGYMFMTKNQNATPKPKPEKTMAMDEFVVNLADEDIRVYIKAKIFLAYTDTKIETELKDKMPQIRDLVITTIRLKKSTEFDGIKLENIRKELIGKINSKLTSGQITNVYFYDIIIQ
ncbi:MULTISPECIES: flagellar basal body-associated FliL family protein [Caloramator]|jgi:flagellar FliL protein|uniref:Flagellar protein FliL n=2 Tax=Caloramator TaxID=44258 RepID=I7KSM9_9CLOT|nr:MULTISPECIES: flagellar basal body-associated FliL family protein [Caloramator]MDO6355415.1 flagellar basal body-associated FliL family protein [Caloramator sp. CAR-1]CCJ32608.1 Flagellar biosynthesis protein FliL [Caloramator australicus RC3]